ncbi:MAG: cbb3-type cytochrome c oxidase subunit I, partial [Deltaproteobacteria bacterium]
MTSAAWFAFATSVGMIAAGYLIAPDFMANIGFLVFSRIRPIHVNLVLFGFVTQGFLASAFYFVPRLLRAELYSQKLGLAAVLILNLAVIAGLVGLSAGHTQGREYAEFIWPVDMLIVIAFVLIVFNLIMTVKQRKEPVLYVSVWYVLAAVV